jgi:molybdenum ABC transporter ATP-binding protein
MLRAELRVPRRSFELDVALEVNPGDCLALAGPSGSGKTTMLRGIAGLLTPRGGRVECGDEVWLDLERRIDVPPERRRCGYVFQEYALFEHQRVWRNVAYGMRRRSREIRRRRALELLERFGVAHLADLRPSRLSGGERQRVALARALASEPPALLLDEPLAALDSRTRGEARRALAEVLAAAEVPAVLVTHDFEEAALFGDEVAILDAGHVVQRGRAAEVAAAPANSFVADFSGAVVLVGTARRAPRGGALVELDGGGVVASTREAVGRAAASVYPWEISLDPPGAGAHGSIRNHLPATVSTITVLGGRVRVGLDGPQPLTAEITEASLHELGLGRGSPVVASWKAAATRLSPI